MTVDLISKWRIKILQNQQFNFRLENYTHIKEFYNKECGDKCEVFLDIEGNIIKKISYSLHGCGIQTAALELVCEHVLDNSIENVQEIQKEIQKLEIEKNRKHCLIFVEEICDWIIECIE